MFVQNMLLASRQVLILYILVAAGAIADKTKIFTEKTAKACTNLLFYIITPCVILRSFLEIEYSDKATKNLLAAVGCGLLLHLTASLISLPFFRRGDGNRNCVFKYASVHGNCGYMALPLANAVLGPQGVFYCSAVIISFQICAFTYGVTLMSGDKSAGAEKARFELKRILLNPGVLSVVTSLPLYLLHVSMPSAVMEPVRYIASMNTPLAMLIFGTYIANTKWGTMFKEKKILGVAALKLIALPLLMLGMYRLFGLSGTLLSSLVLSSSSPPANNTVMFAAKYGKDTGLAAQVVTAVSLISIVTMPAMIALSMIF
ncbi:MAG: AEC family transporter [Oscillospiraceae bacterium]|nr:AEC family transporter [Oscillospiraceae bacterium]